MPFFLLLSTAMADQVHILIEMPETLSVASLELAGPRGGQLGAVTLPGPDGQPWVFTFTGDSPAFRLELTRAGGARETQTLTAAPGAFGYHLAPDYVVWLSNNSALPAAAVRERFLAEQPRAPEADQVLLAFPAGPRPDAVEVVCKGGFRSRVSVTAGWAAFDGVPAGDECSAAPKGVVATSVPVEAGKAYRCDVVGTTSVCRAP